MEKPELLYAQEHVSCKNYAAEDAIIQIRVVDQGECLSYGDDHRSFLFFLLQGEMRCQCNTQETVSMHAHEMCFVMRGEIFRGEALGHAVALVCFLDATIALCNEYTIKSLSQVAVNMANEDLSVPYILPINDILLAELNTTQVAVNTGLLCYHYQRGKRDIFLLMLRGFYPKIELAKLFHPILSEDFDFKQVIQLNYTSQMNVGDMIACTGMPPASFNRKFMKAFGTTPRQWLTQKKSKSILCDLQMSDLTIKEIACKYGLTPNYFIKFCQLHLGNTPIELRRSALEGTNADSHQESDRKS